MTERPPILQVSDVVRSFGGIMAVAGATFLYASRKPALVPIASR